MTRTGKHLMAIKTLCAAIAIALSVTLLACPFASHASTAYADDVPVWHYAGMRHYTDLPDPANVTVDIGTQSVKSAVHIKFIDSWLEESARGGVSWNEQVSWNDPPAEIPVGSEPDVWISFNGSYDRYVPPDFSQDSTHYYNDNGEVLSIGHQSLHPTLTPLPSPFCYIGYRSFDTSNMTADAVFAEMQKHFDAEGGFSRLWFGNVQEMFFPSSNTVVALYADSGYYMDPNYTGEEPNTRQYFKDRESGVMSDKCHVLEGEDPSAVHGEGTQAMFIVVSVAVGDGLGYVHTVYLYTSEPGTAGSTPQQHVTVSSDASKEGGEDGGWVIPAAVVGGLAVAGGAVALGRRGRKKDGSDPDPDDGKRDEEPQSTFRMQLYKEFGDTLFVGANVETVGARIEEVRADGTVLDRPDLTARITFGASDNLEARAIGMQGRYQCLNVKAASADSPTAIVAITFTGEGGTFTNNVKFKVGKSELFFGDVALTFIAGYRQTLSIPFCFKGMQLPPGTEPTFECTVWAAVAGQGSDYFTDVTVVRDREHPQAVWYVRLTETGAAPTLEPGELERFTCEVVAKWQTGAGEQTLSGIFDLYRFVEGIRLHVEPLKCYAVDRQAKFVEFRGRGEGETPAEFREKLDAWRAQLPEDTAANEYVIPVECAGVVAQAARSVIRATLYTWAAGQVDADGRFVSGPYGEKFAEMPPWDGTEGWRAIKAVNPLPEFGKTKIEFADVAGSSVLKDAEGNDVARPCEAMGFGYFLKKVDHEHNEQTFHVVATKGVLTPPNRVQVDVTVRIEWGGRAFERTERVMAISQPWRADYAEKAAAYDVADAEKRERLEYIQRKILNSDTATWKIEGGLSLTETMGAIADGLGEKTLVEGAKDAVFGGGQGSLQKGALKAAGKAAEASPMYQFANSVERAGRVAVNVVGSIPGRLETRYMTYTEYGDMMPLYHYIQAMLDGYDAHYGFHEPDYIRATGSFLRRARGETGPAQAAMEALFSRELQYADAVRMTVKDWNSSWLMIGMSVGCSIATAGLSDVFFIPLAAIGKGLEGAIDCIDKGGASNLEIFRSTLDAAGRQLVFDIAMGKVVEEGMKWGGWGARFAKETAEGMSQWVGAERVFQGAVGGLKSVFSSGASGRAVSGAAKVLSRELDEANKVALAAKKAFEESADSLAGEVVERDISYCLGRIEGKLKLGNIEKVMKSGAKDLTRFERRQLLYAIQSDKRAMRALMADTSELGVAARKFYNAEIREVQKKAIHMARVRLANKYHIKFDEIRVSGATGNVADDVARGLKTPMDLDVTFEQLVINPQTGNRKWVSITEAKAQPIFDQELFKIVHGYEGADEVAEAFGRAADHTVVSRFGPESYGKWEDAMRVVNAHRAGETLEDATTVGLTAERKCVHWENCAKQARAEAKALRASGDVAQAQLLEEAAEAFTEEGGRQFTKQASRIVEERIAVLKKAGVEIPYDVQSFLNKKMAIDLMGIEKVNGATAADAEAMLRTQFHSSLEETYHELNELTVLLNDLMAKLNGDYVAPDVVKSL